MEDRIGLRAHKIVLDNRNYGTITGVVDVISFDTKEVDLMTEEGALLLKGDDLHVKRLTVEKGEVEITGRIDSLIYANQKTKKEESLVSRLFR